MFLSSIALKNLRDRRAGLFWWSIGFVLLNISVVSIYPSIQETAPELERYIESLPDAFKAAFGLEGAAALTSPAGFLSAELFTLMIPVMFLIFAIGFGAGAIAGEEEAGTLSLLLANPIPRWRVVFEKWLAMVLGMAFLGLIVWLSLVVGAGAFDMDIGMGQLAAATTSSALLGLSFGMVALAVGCATGRKGLAVAVAVAVTTASYLLNILAKIVESLEAYDKLSLFYYTTDTDPLTHGLKIGDAAVFVGTILVLLILALVSFERRDLAV